MYKYYFLQHIECLSLRFAKEKCNRIFFGIRASSCPDITTEIFIRQQEALCYELCYLRSTASSRKLGMCIMQFI